MRKGKSEISEIDLTPESFDKEIFDTDSHSVISRVSEAVLTDEEKEKPPLLHSDQAKADPLGPPPVAPRPIEPPPIEQVVE